MTTNTQALLHIENDALVARAVSRALRRSGFGVQTIDSCTGARDVLTRFRVGIFDIDLSDGNGVTLAEELRKRGTVTHAIFFTATTDADLQSRARRTGPVVSKTQGVTALLNELLPQLAEPVSASLS